MFFRHNGAVVALYLKGKILVQWNLVNTGGRGGACQNVRIIGVSVLSELSNKKLRKHVLLMKRPRQTFFFVGQKKKRFNCTLAVTSFFYNCSC